MSNQVIDLPTHPVGASGGSRPSLSMVYGGGGAVGIAWHVGVIDALRDAGLAVAEAPSIGTSAGSWACGAARLGVGFDQFAAFGELNLPDRRPGLLASLARDVFGDARITNASISVTALPTMRRHLLDSSRHDLADLIAASSAVPGVFSPHTIGGTQYVDGGVRSMASADAAAGADLLVASLPIGGPLFGPVGRAFERTTRRALDLVALASRRSHHRPPPRPHVRQRRRPEPRRHDGRRAGQDALPDRLRHGRPPPPQALASSRPDLLSA